MTENKNKPINQEFIKISDYLRDFKKITFEQQAATIGITYQKVRNIHRGSSSANREIVAKLKMYYDSELKEFFEPKVVDEIKQQNELLEKEVLMLRARFEQMIIDRQASLERKYEDLEDRIKKLEGGNITFNKSN